MGRLDKLKREAINEANVRVLNEQIVDKGKLTLKQKYELLDSEEVTTQDIVQIMKSAIGTFNDDEAVMQAAIIAIKDKAMYDEISKLLKKDLVNWLLTEFSHGGREAIERYDAGLEGKRVNWDRVWGRGMVDFDYTRDNLGGGKETIYQGLLRLGVISGGAENISKSDGNKEFTFKGIRAVPDREKDSSNRGNLQY
jgi:hypothetical protein